MTELDPNKHRTVTIKGFVIPMAVYITRGYLKGESGVVTGWEHRTTTLVSDLGLPITCYGVALQVTFPLGNTQMYPIINKQGELVNKYMDGMFEEFELRHSIDMIKLKYTLKNPFPDQFVMTWFHDDCIWSETIKFSSNNKIYVYDSQSYEFVYQITDVYLKVIQNRMDNMNGVIHQ